MDSALDIQQREHGTVLSVRASAGVPPMTDDHDDPLMRLEDDPVHDTVHQPYSAFNQGFCAAEQDIPRSLNPYQDETIEQRMWGEGYDTFLEQQP